MIWRSASQIAELIKKKEVTSKEVLEETLKQIHRIDRLYHAYITIDEEKALKQAQWVDKKIAHNEQVGPLAGVPIAVKDNICTKDLLTTCGSRILDNFYPPYDATVIEKLKKAGVVIIGKTNCDEFAMGSSTENSVFFPTKNPWDEKRVPGGSSGGSAVAVSAGEAYLALGSDTGGSVRQPAGFCGVYGLKPTYGRVSRYGLVAFASSLDQIGPFARNVADLALLLEVISGHDHQDSTSLPDPVPEYSKLLDSFKKENLKIGVPSDLLTEGLSTEVKEALNSALLTLRKMGFSLEEVSLPHAKYGIPTYYLIAPAEASANLARYDGIKYGHRVEGDGDLLSLYTRTRSEGFGLEVKRRIMLGTFALSLGYRDAYYLKAQKVRTLIARDFHNAFSQVDLIALPTSPTLPFRLKEKLQDPLSMYMSDLYTIPVSLAGLPSISLPIAFQQGLPVGMQIVGPQLSELLILQVSRLFEEESHLHDLKPPLKVETDA